MNIVRCVCVAELTLEVFSTDAYIAISIPAKSLSMYTVFIKGCPHSVSHARPYPFHITAIAE